MSEALVTNYDEIAELKGQLAELRQMLAEMHEVNAELHKEIASLQKDKERLDNWLLGENSCTHIERGRYNRLGDWLFFADSEY